MPYSAFLIIEIQFLPIKTNSQERMGQTLTKPNYRNEPHHMCEHRESLV